MWVEDELYAQWRLADETQRPELERKLLGALKAHAEIAVWQELQENNRDLIQDIAAAALAGLPQFRGDSECSTWVHRIALNNVREEIRRRSRERKSLGYPIELCDERGEERFGTKHPDLAGKADAERAFAKLSEDNRNLLRLKSEGRTDAEVARIQDIPLDAAESQWRRLRKKLRNAIQARRESELSGN